MLIRFREMLKQLAGMNLKQMTKELAAGSTLWHSGISPRSAKQEQSQEFSANLIRRKTDGLRYA